MLSATNFPSTPQWQPGPSKQHMSFKNCQEAKDAGVAPLRRGNPGYRKELDADGDGIACDQ